MQEAHLRRERERFYTFIIKMLRTKGEVCGLARTKPETPVGKKTLLCPEVEASPSDRHRVARSD